MPLTDPLKRQSKHLTVPASEPVMELIVLLTAEAVCTLLHQPAQLNLQHLTAVVVCYSSFLTTLDYAGGSVFGGTHGQPLSSIYSIVVKKFCQLHAAALQPAVVEPAGEVGSSQSCPTLQLAKLLRGRPPCLSKIVLEERQGSAVWRH